MPGYDRSRIVGLSSGDLEEFICGICVEVFNKPTVTQCCGQTSCNDCITERLNDNSVCPYDRKPLTINQLLTPPKVVTNILNKLAIKCEYNERGCQTVVRLGDLEKHQASCKFNPYLVCANCGCGSTNHSREECIEALDEKLNERQTNFEILIQQTYETARYPASIHQGIRCDCCETRNINGIRYKCTVCSNYDLCENCEKRVIHFEDLEMIKIRVPRRRHHRVYYGEEQLIFETVN